MLRTVFLTAFVLVVAIGGGAASAWYMIDRAFGFGAIAIGPWLAFPDRGTPVADPYSKARFAREGGLSLGQAEGITFTAVEDSSGLTLISECDYVVEGGLPPARFWTLHVLGDRHQGQPHPVDRRSSLHSLGLLRNEDNSFAIAVSRHPSPGNWLRSPNGGEIALVLTLYDTAVASSARVADIELPQILRVSCD